LGRHLRASAISEADGVFGNSGSTEEIFLKNFPSDFRYILALQEATAVAMADGFAQATGRPALVNVHTAAGVGNGMCNIMTAFLNKTPLIVVAGRQTREMIVSDPLLKNRDETMLPRPWAKKARYSAKIGKSRLARPIDHRLLSLYPS
jgi:benzoylformate decarboxylase